MTYYKKPGITEIRPEMI